MYLYQVSSIYVEREMSCFSDSDAGSLVAPLVLSNIFPGIPTTIKTMGVNITTIVYLRVLIIQIESTIILMVVEAQGFQSFFKKP